MIAAYIWVWVMMAMVTGTIGLMTYPGHAFQHGKELVRERRAYGAKLTLVAVALGPISLPFFAYLGVRALVRLTRA